MASTLVYVRLKTYDNGHLSLSMSICTYTLEQWLSVEAIVSKGNEYTRKIWMLSSRIREFFSVVLGLFTIWFFSSRTSRKLCSKSSNFSKAWICVLFGFRAKTNKIHRLHKVMVTRNALKNHIFKYGSKKSTEKRTTWKWNLPNVIFTENDTHCVCM